MEEFKIFSGSTSQQFAKKICDFLEISLGNSETIIFSEGNTFVRIKEKVRDKDIYIVQTVGLDPNNEFMELLFWIDACRRASAKTVTAVVPFFSYSKGDKKDEPRVSIRARVCADCLEVTGVDRIITMDLHSPQIQGFFKKPVDHLYGRVVLTQHIKNMKIKDLVVVSPDAGFAKDAREFASILKVPVAICDKARYAHDESAKVLELIGDVKGKNALIVDDFTISCGTLCDTARILKEHGAEHIYACVSHGLLNEKGIQRLEKSNVEKLIVTDTVENRLLSHSPKVEIVSVSELFAQAIQIIQHKESLSQLFEIIEM